MTRADATCLFHVLMPRADATVIAVFWRVLLHGGEWRVGSNGADVREAQADVEGDADLQQPHGPGGPRGATATKSHPTRRRTHASARLSRPAGSQAGGSYSGDAPGEGKPRRSNACTQR